MGEAVFNLKRSAMFVDAMHTKDSQLMRYALRDKLHHPYRSRLIPGFQEIRDDLAEIPNVIGTVISGAGPSIIVIHENNSFDEIHKRINTVWEGLGVKVTVKKLNIDTQGAVILP
jgi:homoserine kinase